MAVNVDFVDDNLSGILLGEFFHKGGDTESRTAPIGVKVNDGGQCAFVFESFFLVNFANFLGEFGRGVDHLNGFNHLAVLRFRVLILNDFNFWLSGFF